MITRTCSGSKNFVAEFVDDQVWNLEPGYVQTTTIQQGKSGVCFATTVTDVLLEDTVDQQHYSRLHTNI